jgi:hypothetical protein
MLRTNLQHITSEDDFKDVIKNNENVMICCGRMGPMCLPVYSAMSEIKDTYQNVAFFLIWNLMLLIHMLFGIIPCRKVLWDYPLHITLKTPKLWLLRPQSNQKIK